MLPTREKRLPVQSGAVGITVAKAASGTGDICVAVIANPNVPKVWTADGNTKDCLILPFGL
jgi:hypothetical protein